MEVVLVIDKVGRIFGVGFWHIERFQSLERSPNEQRNGCDFLRVRSGEDWLNDTIGEHVSNGITVPNDRWKKCTRIETKIGNKI